MLCYGQTRQLRNLEEPPYRSGNINDINELNNSHPSSPLFRSTQVPPSFRVVEMPPKSGDLPRLSPGLPQAGAVVSASWSFGNACETHFRWRGRGL